MTEALVAHDRQAQVDSRVARPRSPETGLSFGHILVPLDGSARAERALRFLRAIARATSSRVTLLQTLEPPQRPTARAIDPVEWEMIRADAQAYLAGVAEGLRAYGIESQVTLEQGFPAEQIASFARRQAVDLILMSSHGSGAPDIANDSTDIDWPLGSTVQRVIATAPTSLLIVPTTKTRPGDNGGEVELKRMLLPLDCSPRAECILSAAIDLAKHHDAELLLAHVVPEPEMPRRMGPSREDIKLAEQIVERNRCEAARYLRDIQARISLDYDHIRTILCVAPKRAQTLADLAQREHVDLIILAAHGSTGDAHHRYGGVAAKFLYEGYGPVIILQDLAEPAACELAARSPAQEPRAEWG